VAATPDGFDDIARAIQLALAPVFLLTGIAGMLSVMTGRLGRIIDRGRVLTDRRAALASSECDEIDREQRGLARRRHLANVAITACTIAALLVCMVIAALFLEVVLRVPFRSMIAILFTGAMLALVVGLACFLREVHLAMQGIRTPARGAE
jgi:hypothetical protein